MKIPGLWLINTKLPGKKDDVHKVTVIETPGKKKRKKSIRGRNGHQVRHRTAKPSKDDNAMKRLSLEFRIGLMFAACVAAMTVVSLVMVL